MVPMFILLTTVQNLVVMSWISFSGNVLIVTAMAIVIVRLLIMPHIPISNLNGVTTIPDAAVAAGSITYAYLAQAVVLPLENQMRNPHRMLGFFGVISMAVVFVGVLYGAMGFLGYITYGSKIEGSITLNLSNEPLDLSVKVMLLIMMYCGYLIQHYPIFSMIWPMVQRLLTRCTNLGIYCSELHASLCHSYYVIAEQNLRQVLLAITIPNLEDIIPIIGATTGMLLAFVFPPTLESVIFWEQWRKRGYFTLIFNLTLNIVYILMGILFLIMGVHTNIQSMKNSKHS
ncbi:transmembrane amino acid transporter protein [Cooperia oncophora]